MNRQSRLWVTTFLLGAAASACNARSEGTMLAQQCTQAGLCPTGLVCIEGYCYPDSQATNTSVDSGESTGDGDGDLSTDTGPDTSGDGDGDGDDDPSTDTGCTPGTLGCTCDGGVCALGLFCDGDYVCSEEVCGDGIVSPNEECDGNDLQNEDCMSLGFNWGDLSCDPVTCEFDTSACGNGALCGNGVVEIGEQCDGNDLNGFNCTDLGFGPGNLMCDRNCLLDPTFCG